MANIFISGEGGCQICEVKSGILNMRKKIKREQGVLISVHESTQHLRDVHSAEIYSLFSGFGGWADAVDMRAQTEHNQTLLTQAIVQSFLNIFGQSNPLCRQPICQLCMAADDSWPDKTVQRDYEVDEADRQRQRLITFCSVKEQHRHLNAAHKDKMPEDWMIELYSECFPVLTDELLSQWRITIPEPFVHIRRDALMVVNSLLVPANIDNEQITFEHEAAAQNKSARQPYSASALMGVSSACVSANHTQPALSLSPALEMRMCSPVLRTNTDCHRIRPPMGPPPLMLNREVHPEQTSGPQMHYQSIPTQTQADNSCGAAAAPPAPEQTYCDVPNAWTAAWHHQHNTYTDTNGLHSVSAHCQQPTNTLMYSASLQAPLFTPAPARGRGRGRPRNSVSDTGGCNTLLTRLHSSLTHSQPPASLAPNTMPMPTLSLHPAHLTQTPTHQHNYELHPYHSPIDGYRRRPAASSSVPLSECGTSNAPAPALYEHDPGQAQSGMHTAHGMHTLLLANDRPNTRLFAEAPTQALYTGQVPAESGMWLTPDQPLPDSITKKARGRSLRQEHIEEVVNSVARAHEMTPIMPMPPLRRIGVAQTAPVYMSLAQSNPVLDETLPYLHGQAVHGERGFWLNHTHQYEHPTRTPIHTYTHLHTCLEDETIDVVGDDSPSPKSMHRSTCPEQNVDRCISVGMSVNAVPVPVNHDQLPQLVSAKSASAKRTRH